MPTRHLRRRPLALACALLAGAAAAGLRAEETDGLTVTTGLLLATDGSASRALFGQYDGLRRREAELQFGFGYERRDDDGSGRWLRFEGRRLFGPTRELDLRWTQPGDWKIAARYAEQVRHDPNEISTGDELEIRRTGLGLALVKTLSPRLQVELELRSERREGRRLWGIGMTCPSSVAPTCGGTTGVQTGWALLMLPEPIDADHSELEARLNYAQGALRLFAGYRGSFYRNALGSLNPSVPGTLNNPLGVPLATSPELQALLQQPVALPPDNQAHQLDLTGTVALQPTTQLSFKLGRTLATQDQSFAAAGFTSAPAGVTSLGGRVDTTTAQLGLTARPRPALSLQARLRYEDRDDRTPLAAYNVEGSASYTNRRLDSTRWRGLLEAGYQLSPDVRGTLGADHETIDRGVFTPTSAIAGTTALRQETAETGVRAELRRRLNENFSGSVALSSSRRTGSNWLKDNSGLGVTEVPDPQDPAAGLGTGIFMPTLADRRRDKVRLTAEWQPSDELALQASAQSGFDRFSSPSAYGLRRSGMNQVALDATYAWSQAWNFTASLAHGTESLRQARPESASLAYENTSSSAGLGVVGKPIARLQVGGQFTWLNDRSRYRQTLGPTVDGAGTSLLEATGGLPDIVFRQAVWRMYARYELDKQSEVRVDLVHHRSAWTDWAWGYDGVPFSYSDGTTVAAPAHQSASIVGVSYVYRWR